ncbi:MAG: hypothetical protein NVS4B2_28590 [Chloroflexota bacterium]
MPSTLRWTDLRDPRSRPGERGGIRHTHNSQTQSPEPAGDGPSHGWVLAPGGAWELFEWQLQDRGKTRKKGCCREWLPRIGQFNFPHTTISHDDFCS